jgi:putative redox protein
MLDARLELPAGTPRAFAVFAHCFTCSKDSSAASRISRALAARGIAALRFDFTGLGGSEGDFANTHFRSNLDDLVAAARWLEEFHAAPTMLVGHSLGGAAVIAAAHRIPSVRAVVAVAAPSDPSHATHLFADSVDTVCEVGEAVVSIAGRPFRVKRELLVDLAQHNVLEHAHGLGRALLLLHSPVDEVVGVEHARALYDAALHPKSFISLDRADHLLKRREDAEFVAAMMATWAERYALLPTSAESQEPPPNPKLAKVTPAKDSPYSFDVEVGGHRFRVDEPREEGGSNTGPSPTQYLAGALGACTAITMRMYANRKEIPLEKVSVDVEYARVANKDLPAELRRPEGTTTVARLDRAIDMQGPLSEDQRARLMEIAERCPVHRALAEEAVVVTTQKTPGGAG